MPKILIGFMGAGKSTVGKLLDPNFYDMDLLIVDRIGMSINEFFAKEGEEAFRKIETELLDELIQIEDAVISPGGGIVLNPHNRELIKQNDCNIFLDVSFDVLYDRIGKDTGLQRPLYLNNTREEFKAIFDSREDMYREVATQIINVDDKTPEEIVAIIEGK